MSAHRQTWEWARGRLRASWTVDTVPPTTGVATDTTDWTTVTVPGTPLTVRFPATWYVSRRPRRPGTTPKVFEAAARRDGPNLQVTAFVDHRATWYDDAAEFAEMAQGVTPGRLVGIAHGAVGALPMYRVVDRFQLGKRTRLFGYEEVLVKEGELTVAFSATVEHDQAALLFAVLDGVGIIDDVSRS